jgi:hypothetical protein
MTDRQTDQLYVGLNNYMSTITLESVELKPHEMVKEHEHPLIDDIISPFVPFIEVSQPLSLMTH